MDIQSMWQAHDEMRLGLSPAEVRARADKLNRTIHARNSREWIASAFVVVCFTAIAVVSDDLVARVGCGLVVAGTAFVAWYIRARGRTRALPEDGLPGLAFYRGELARQRDLLRSVWRWYLGPLIPGLGVLTLHRLLASPDLSAVLSILFVVVVFAGIGRLNHLAAAELQRQLDALPITGEHAA